MMKQENANGAAKSLRQTNIQKRELVAEVAVISSVGIKAIRKVGRADVYNMEVEGNHNFAIEGGLIVHNCMDSMRYFVKTKHIVKEKTMYKSIFGVTY